ASNLDVGVILGGPAVLDALEPEAPTHARIGIGKTCERLLQRRLDVRASVAAGLQGASRDRCRAGGRRPGGRRRAWERRRGEGRQGDEERGCAHVSVLSGGEPWCSLRLRGRSTSSGRSVQGLTRFASTRPPSAIPDESRVLFGNAEGDE